MKSHRLEAFSDGVLAIIITIMVLQLRVPEQTDLNSLLAVLPVFLSYVISFVYVGIYWNNHHHLFQMTQKINGKVLWTNLHLLLWLSLIPFTTAWVGENHEAVLPVAAYGFVLLMCAIAYLIMQHQLSMYNENSKLKNAIGNDRKGKISLVLYVMGIGIAFLNTWLSILCYVAVAVIWFIPDLRIEKKYNSSE